jgi:hypothetical protein
MAPPSSGVLKYWCMYKTFTLGYGKNKYGFILKTPLKIDVLSLDNESIFEIV